MSTKYLRIDSTDKIRFMVKDLGVAANILADRSVINVRRIS